MLLSLILGFSLFPFVENLDMSRAEASMHGETASNDRYTSNPVHVKKIAQIPNYGLGIWFICMLIVLSILCVLCWFVDRCPNCGRPNSWKQTGEKEREYLYQNWNYEYRCNRSGHTDWLEINYFIIL